MKAQFKTMMFTIAAIVIAGLILNYIAEKKAVKKVKSVLPKVGAGEPVSEPRPAVATATA